MAFSQAGYQKAYGGFDLSRATEAVLGDVSSGLNVATLCCDRHCGSNSTALYWRNDRGEAADYSFEQLRDQSERFAQVLQDLGVGRGDRVACLLPRIPELVASVLAVWRLGAVYQPLFTAFGPKAIDHRVQSSAARVIVTDSGNRAKLDEIISPAKIVTVAAKGAAAPVGDLDFHNEIAQREPGLQALACGADDPFLMMFTSGTTGPAKSLYVPIRAIVPFAGYMRDALDLRPEDGFWNIADPGWAYGLYYAVVGPLALGHATLLYDGPFSVESTEEIIIRDGITNLAGAPTAFRHVVAAGPEAVGKIKGRLRVVSSAGEPLNPEVIRWFANHLDVVIHDHYGQTELGMVLCNHHGLAHPVLPGAAGYSMPGFRVVVVDENNQELGPGKPGTLAIDRSRSPLFWFTGYEGRNTPTLGERYYLSGDTVELNDNGSISFVGRADDVITSSGYRIGPFDVESALLEHPAVVETAVIGKPDPKRTEIVKAFVVLANGMGSSPELADELRSYVRTRLSAHAYPREIEFVDTLPKTPSGKIQRFLLRDKEKQNDGAGQGA